MADAPWKCKECHRPMVCGKCGLDHSLFVVDDGLLCWCCLMGKQRPREQAPPEKDRPDG